MEKSDLPVNDSWFGEGEIVDADLLVDLLETYRFGKSNVPVGKNRSKTAPPAPVLPDNTSEKQEAEDDNGSPGNKSVHESISSASSNSDPVNVILESTLTETGSDNETGSDKEPGSNEETGYNWLEFTNLPNVENEMHEKAEDGEIEEEENNERSPLSESEEELDLEKLLAIQEKYELYCPSCTSCITRKVILKKKKRGKHVDLSADLKPDVSVVDESSDIEEAEAPVKVHVPETCIETKEEGVIFTCLACLKYYIRLGARFLQLDYTRGKPVEEPVEVHLEAKKSSNTTESPLQIKPDRERFAVELLKSTVYGGLTETITSLGVVSSASASGSSTVNILALAVANLAGGVIILAQNLQDLRNNSDQEKDRYEELLGRRANSRIHILVAVLSYILFGLIPPLVYAFSFYETEIKNYKLVSVFLVSLVCVILLGMIKVYVRKPPNMKGMVRFAAFKPNLCHIISLDDGSGISSFMSENFWDLTPDTELLKELPENYNSETALADLIDNSLQAVWPYRQGDRKLISVDVSGDRISVIDTGKGMDSSEENSIVKWGKIGASLHRSEKTKDNITVLQYHNDKLFIFFEFTWTCYCFGKLTSVSYNMHSHISID